MEEDKYLYKEFLNGNKNAFEKLMLKHKNNIVYFITRYIKDMELSEDIFQDVVVYILENKEKYDFNYTFKTYMYMIAKSKAIDYIKHEKYTESIEEKEYADTQLLEEIIFSKERKTKIQNVISKMPSDYQIVIYLTQIEGISYRETAKIMGKTERQIKTLAYNARKKLRQLLIEERVIEMKENKVIMIFLLFVIVCVVTSGIVYASVKIYERVKGQASLTPVFTGEIGDTDMNSVWVGSFQLAWNEFMENVIGGKIEFEDGNNQFVNELNKKSFTKDELSEKDYYIKVGETSPKLKEEIINDIENKFNFKNSTILDKIDFENATDNSYTIYSILIKEFEFLTPFDKIGSYRFANSEELVEYFGINNASEEDINKNVEVLFYNDRNDFAVSLITKENEEIILYRTNNTKSFTEIYKELIEKNNKYEGNKEFTEVDELKIPYINVDTIINYSDLCGHIIKNTNEKYIANAFQNVIFKLTEKGGNLVSEAGIKSEYNLETEGTIYFNYTDDFVIFIKEKEKKLPYFSLRVNNTDVLQLSDMET